MSTCFGLQFIVYIDVTSFDNNISSISHSIHVHDNSYMTWHIISQPVRMLVTHLTTVTSA